MKQDLNEITTLAQSLARSGGFANWQAVQARLLVLGHDHAEALFADLNMRAAFDAICAANRKS